MSLEDLLRSGTIRRARPDPRSSARSLRAAKRDIDTAKMLAANGKFDWALSIAYNAMLLAGRALMLKRGFRPSSSEGHVAVIRFLRAALKSGAGSDMVLAMNGMRKKRHRAVYEEMDTISGIEAKRALSWAEAFVEMVGRLV